ncbi:MAG: penicillin-binding protein 2 [Gammaproteobacteria bacterium]
MQFEERHKERNSFSNRILVSFIVFTILFLAVLGRIFYLQISTSETYLTAAESNRTYTVPVQTLRGEIFDRNGNLLIGNRATFDLVTVPAQIEDLDVFIEQISEIMPLSVQSIEDYKNLFNSKALYNRELVLLKDLSEEEIAAFQVRSFRFPGAFVGKRYRRISEYPELFSHALGYTSRASATFTNLPGVPSRNWRDAEYVYASGLINGQIGLEKIYNESLSGSFGKKIYEIDAKGRLHNLIRIIDGKPGEDLYTSLDLNAQLAAQKAINGKRGAVVAIHLATGGLSVLYSSPSFSINEFANGIGQQTLDQVIQDVNKPLFNRALKGRYPPASSIKPAIALYGLNANLTSWDRKIEDPGYFKLPEDGRIYRGWRKGGHGTVDLTKALVQSSNTYFFDLAYQSDIDQLTNHLANMGFGKSLCIDCFDEDQGLLPTPEWKYAQYNKGWFKGDTVNMGVGQGYILATPIQLAYYASILANKGEALLPHFGLETSIQATAVEASNSNWSRIHQALELVVEGPSGTANRLSELKSFKVAAKTGTAELVSLDSKEAYAEVRSDVLQRDHAIIIAFGPLPNPEYAVSVVIENGESGGLVAGPVAIEVLKALIER